MTLQVKRNIELAIILNSMKMALTILLSCYNVTELAKL